RFQNAAFEFRQFVQKQHAVMRQRNFAGRWIDVAAQQTSIAGGVMRRAKWPARYQRLAGSEQPDDAVNLGRLQRFLQRKRRQNGGEPFGQHRFSGARRADQQHVVAAGGRDFQRALHRFLAFDFREIQFVVQLVREEVGNVYFRRRNFHFAFQKARRLAQILDGNHGQARDDRRLRRIVGRYQHAELSLGPRAQRDGEHAFDRAHGAGERQFANQNKIVQLIGFQLL